MMLRALLLLLASLPLLAQARRMSVEDLVKFVKSAVQLKQQDKQVASYIERIKLDYQLEERVIEDLQGLGAGPRTVAALKQLRADSLNLPQPPAPVAKAIVAPLAGPSSIEQERILDRVREQALQYTKSLPDFICVQVTRRYFDPAGAESWNLMDTVITRLSFFEGKENYKVVSVNNRPVDLDWEKLGGTTSSGEFGSLLYEIFAPKSQAEIRWERWATLRGRRMHVFAYKLDVDKSPFSIRYVNQSTASGSKGLLYCDRETNEIMRIVQEADGIEPGFPIQAVKRVLDYDYQEIANNTYLVPLRADIRSRAGKELTRNAVEFRLYQKFGVETDVIIPDTLDELPEDKEQPAAPASKPKP